VSWAAWKSLDGKFFESALPMPIIGTQSWLGQYFHGQWERLQEQKDRDPSHESTSQSSPSLTTILARVNLA
jgi:hypothetical protein